MTNLISVKSLNELHLNGVKIDWVKEDASVKEVRFHDGNGGRLVIRVGDYGSTLKVMVCKPHEEVDRWRLHGKLADLADISEHFDDEYQAQERLREFESKVRCESGLTISKVKVKVNDGGEVVNSTTDDDIQF